MDCKNSGSGAMTPATVGRRQAIGTLLLSGVGIGLGGCSDSGGNDGGIVTPAPTYTLTLSTNAVAPGQTGPIAQLSSNVAGTASFAKVSGPATLDIATSGAIALSVALVAGETLRFEASVRGSGGGSVTASFEIKAAVSLADIPPSSLFVAGAVAGSLIVALPIDTSWTPDSAADADKLRVDNGRLVVGNLVAAAGVITGTLRHGALSQPHRVRVLPALPLDNGAKVMAFGHSFVANAVQQVYLASQTETAGHQGQYLLGRGPLNWLAHGDGRFNTDVIPELAHPMFPPSSYYALSGAQQGKGGDTIRPGVEAPNPTDPGVAPGTLARSPYVLARAPDIIYLDIGLNDAFRGVALADLIKAYDEQIATLTMGGAWVVLQTLSWVINFAETPDDPRNAVIEGLNAWLLAQDGRPGVRVLDTLALDGPRSGIGAQADTMFIDKQVHPSNLLAAQRGDRLLTLLRTMVRPGERRDLDPLSDNLFPLAGLPGTGGTRGARVSGVVANGLVLGGGTGASTLTGTKASLSPGNEVQLVTVNPVADGIATHSALIRMTAPIPLSALNLRPGDWLHVLLPYQTDDWAGWDFFDPIGWGPVYLDTALYNGSNTSLFRASTGVSGRNRVGTLETKLWWPEGLAADSLRWNTNMLSLRWSSAAPGSGTVRIGSPILRRIADPRPAWNLPGG